MPKVRTNLSDWRLRCSEWQRHLPINKAAQMTGAQLTLLFNRRWIVLRAPDCKH